MLTKVKQHLKNNNITFLDGINLYLFLSILDSLRLSSQELFLTLSATTSIMAALLAFMISGILSIFINHNNQISKNAQFVGLTSCYLLLTILKSPSILITIGFLLLGVAVYTKLSWEKMKGRQLLPLSLLLTTPKVFHLLFYPKAMDLQRFTIQAELWNINHLWTIVLSGLYGILLYALFHQFSDKWYEAISKHKKLTKWLYLLFGILFISYVTYICVISAYKVTTFSVSTFDLGIFSQMFESMKRDFTQLTTLERDKLLSHFGVHISPIYYLILPVYTFFPYAETLEIAQILIVFSGVIPLQLILKKLGLPNFVRPSILLWFMVTPTMTTAGSYHLHENCFLVPLLLWLVYANISQWKWRSTLLILLTLMVKEDAFLYVFTIGLYFLLQSRFEKGKNGGLWLVMSHLLFPLLYFMGCIYLLNSFGDGAMVSRFDNFLLPGQTGLIKVLENIFLHPTYTLASFFSQRKLIYLVMIFLTQAFLPLFQKNWSNYILLIPLVVINLLSDWPYQVDLGFQYSYGSITLVFFLSLLALEAIYQHYKTGRSLASANKYSVLLVSIAILFSSGILHSHIQSWHHDTKSYFQNPKKYQDIQRTLDSLPRDKTVLAYHTYTVALRSVPKLYDLFYHQQQQFDPAIDLVVTPRSSIEHTDTAEAKVISLYQENGYQESPYSTQEVLVLEKR